MFESFNELAGPALREIFYSLNTPYEIQEFLDSIPYSAEDANRCPVSVLHDRQAHCLDGALLAAAALRRLGDAPLLVDMLPEPGRDDDHLIAIFKRRGRYGALAKSNYVGLRYREPVYRSLRELVMSYFEDFYNVESERTLRAYTRPFNLARLDKAGWMWSNAGADAVEQRLYQLKPIPLLTPEMGAALHKLDPLSFQAGRLGVNEAGLYRPHNQ